MKKTRAKKGEASLPKSSEMPSSEITQGTKRHAGSSENTAMVKRGRHASRDSHYSRHGDIQGAEDSRIRSVSPNNIQRTYPTQSVSPDIRHRHTHAEGSKDSERPAQRIQSVSPIAHDDSDEFSNPSDEESQDTDGDDTSEIQDNDGKKIIVVAK